MSDQFSMWTVYEHPTDYPNLFVARLFLILEHGRVARTHTVLKAATLDELRKKLPPGLTCITRAESDDPKIVETWL